MPEACAEWRGRLAAEALGDLTEPERDALVAHLDGCSACRAALAELRGTAAALSRADPSRLAAPTEPPAGLVRGVSARLERERSGRRRRVVAAVAVAAALIAGAIAAVQLWPDQGGGEHIALVGPGLDGRVTLDARSWGTEIHLEGAGFVPGAQYNVWLERADGDRVGAGTFTGVRQHSVAVVLASALPAAQAVALGISRPDGTVITRVELR
jgi:hypothetical protein